MNKRYYTCIKRRNNQIVADTWHCTTEGVLSLKSYDYIIPLDRKPRNSIVREGA